MAAKPCSRPNAVSSEASTWVYFASTMSPKYPWERCTMSYSYPSRQVFQVIVELTETPTSYAMPRKISPSSMKISGR